jgi:hypothetical protein
MLLFLRHRHPQSRLERKWLDLARLELAPKRGMLDKTHYLPALHKRRWGARRLTQSRDQEFVVLRQSSLTERLRRVWERRKSPTSESHRVEGHYYLVHRQCAAVAGIRAWGAHPLPSGLTCNEHLSVLFKFRVVAVQVLFSDFPKIRVRTTE